MPVRRSGERALRACGNTRDTQLEVTFVHVQAARNSYSQRW